MTPGASHLSPSATTTGQPQPSHAAIETLARAPLAFEATAGQPDVYVSRTPRYILRVAPTWAEMNADAAEAVSLRMHLRGANPHPRPVPSPALPGIVNYVVGNNPAAWRTNVATYERIRYDAVYPGIDVVYYGSQHEIEYDFIVAPGASPAQIALGFDGVETLAVQEDGDLALTRDHHEMLLRAPRASQSIEGRSVPVEAHYEIDGQSVSLVVGTYDPTLPLTIDPILSYATALGGSRQDEGNAVAVDAAGNVYVAGFTRSTNFPANGTPAGQFDLFLTKLDPTGSAILSSTYVGGSGPDEARGLAIDASGNAYLTGVTRSTDFPTHNALRTSLNGESDAFVVKMSTTGGGLLFSTYWGGSGIDEGTGIAIDAARNVFVTGVTRSTDFPTASAFQNAPNGLLDAFVTKFTPSGGGPTYSTYFGGNGADQAHGIAADAAGNAVFVGATSSTNFPTQAALRANNSGIFDGFVARLTPAGSLVFSTYVGGGLIDAVQSVTIRADGVAFIAGSTASTDLPVFNAFQPALKGGLDAFVGAFLPAGGNPPLLTYLGGSGSDRGRALALDSSNRLYIVGQTFSADFPSARPVQATIGGNRDTFVTMLEPPYTAISYSTYLGGSNNDDGLGVAADTQGRAYIAGATMFAWPDLAGESDAFVMRVSSGAVGVDSDSDGMPDDWESQYNLDPNSNDASADPDGDGVTNLQEFQNGTHPTGFFTRYLAEGQTGTFWDTQLALFNPAAQTAIVLLRFQQENTPELTRLISLPPHTRQTLNIKSVAGLESASFSTVIEADFDIVADRTMTWDATGFGSHAETALPELSKTWYLAEGSTGGNFDLFYLLQNPNQTQANVTIRYLRPAPLEPIVKTYVVAPRSRSTIHVDDERVGNTRPLAGTDVSGVIEADLPIVVERSMYLTVAGRAFAAGHESSGVTAPSPTWFFAEGATGVFFDMYLLLANPGATPANVTVNYLLVDGTVITRQKYVAPMSRLTVGVDQEAPELLDAPVSTKIVSDVPILAERAMWWPSPNWFEAHNSAGAVVTSPRWAVAEGEVGGPRSADTYVLVANTSPNAGEIRASVYYEDQGIIEPKTYTVPGNSRFNIDMRGEFPQSMGRKFSVIIEGLGATPPELVVERAMYSNQGRTVWAAGTNALGTPLFPEGTFFITPGGVFPKRMVVEDGTRVRYVNRDTVSHEMSSDEHPFNTDCPAINQLGVLAPGESKLTGNMVIDLGINVCGFHDERAGTAFNFTNTALWGRIIIRP